MINYQDKTFCLNTVCKKECNRRMTLKILKEANKLGLPVSQSYLVCDEDACTHEWKHRRLIYGKCEVHEEYCTKCGAIKHD